ncbi:YhgE/Pip domain-containing protein [Virgibacillus litoralis]|nr:YhgE/Pip domain-containing protein [Virgibacillus litoralis]
MRFKRITAVFMICLLVMPTTLVTAATNESSADGTYSEKSEVVYATLNANGDQKEMYVVNSFTVDKPGKMVDFGPYTGIENLTNLTDMKLNDNQVSFTAKEDEFYYQGNIKNKPLPWDINVSYKLNGETVSPDELLGKDGQFEIHIDTKANQKANSNFFENYMLQISLPLNSEIYQNIEAENGTIANAGKNKQVTFTVMPEKEESFVVKADVKDLEMESIEISAVTSSMSIDSPDSEDMTEDMKSLSDATEEINDGVGELNEGIAELNNGAASLQEGSPSYKNGINKLANRSSELIKGSKEIDKALEEMSQSVGSGSNETNVGELKKLQKGLTEIANGLGETKKGLSDLKNKYAKAYKALDKSMAAIPAGDISDDEIKKLKASNADPEVIEKLIKTHKAAGAAKSTYSSVKKAFQAVSPTLDGVIGSLQTMKTNVETMADNLGESLDNMNVDESMKKLQQGLSTLSSNYQSFHSGLADYTGGVSEVSKSYGELHGGITDLTDGTSELENGVNELHEGTTELAESTNDLPDQMQTEIDQMINEYDKSDFNPVSFVSPKNKKVNSVQFVIKTESIKKDDDKQETKEQEEEKKGFWDRLFDLFR